MIDFTPIARKILNYRIKDASRWNEDTKKVQLHQLDYIVKKGRHTLFGQSHSLDKVESYDDFVKHVPMADYEDFRPLVMRMIAGEKDLLWPGVTVRYAQSSGTTGGKSKYIPITDDSLHINHYAGTSYVVAHYLHLYHDSRLFSGKAFILGGSYANELSLPPHVKVGDLSATLIDCMNPMAEMYRVPNKEIALMKDWHDKLSALIDASIKENITNISGVPSWFLTVLKGVIAKAGAASIHDVWPNLEVFFHGGISFAPYSDEYARITTPGKMRFFETYNASEGFFATQSAVDDKSMLLLLDTGIFYEFVPIEDIDDPEAEALPAWMVEPGRTYALVITACNGLWRYRLGDTVRIESVEPLKITIAGRTKSFINAFGEELMVNNAEAAMTRTCHQLGCTVVDYTAGPVYTSGAHKGRHEWWIQWGVPPKDMEEFSDLLDANLQQENSDYQAKRTGGIFLDRLSVRTAPAGLFDAWLESTGKLGGQRKVPRLSNTPDIINSLAALNDKF